MRALSIFVVFGLLLFTCAFLLAADRQISDDELYDEIRRKLANDRDVRGGAIEVEVSEGLVTLRGKVRELKQKTKAERITKKIRGVKKVTNELVIGSYLP